MNLVTNGTWLKAVRQSKAKADIVFLIGNSSLIFNYNIFFATMFFIVDIFRKNGHKTTNISID